MNEAIIETYTDSYRDSVIDLILGIQNEEFNIPISIEQQPDLKAIPTFYQVNHGNFWISRIADQVIGTIALLDIGNHQAALRKMFVAKKYRGKSFGVGQALLNHLRAWASDQNITEIFLGTTEKFIGAQRFYEKNGFIEIPKQSLPTSFPIMEVDVKFYTCSV